MQRESTFRGQRIDTKEWVFGYLFGIWERRYILWGTANNIPNMIEVIPETVGQYTGLKDKNGKAIYENDIVRAKYNTGVELIQTIVFENCRFALFMDKDGGRSWNPMPTLAMHLKDRLYCTEIEVIGNIYENPELLEVSE